MNVTSAIVSDPLPSRLSSPFTAAEAKAGQEAWAKLLGKPVVETNSIGVELVLIPPGEFLMGSPDSETDRCDNETQHRVRLTNPFWLGMHEVTQGGYEQIVRTNPSCFSRSGDCQDELEGLNPARFPVEGVSWYDAVDFCNKLSSREGLPAYYDLTDIERTDGSIKSATVRERNNNGYRLPTEAEWEYACRAGTTSAFHFGDVSNGREANIDGEDPYGTTNKGPYLNRLTTVGSHLANGFGLRDVHGSVWEWCGDWYDAYGKSTETAVDPFNANITKFRVLRGGWCYYVASYSRSAHRCFNAPGYRDIGVGFRVSRTE